MSAAEQRYRLGTEPGTPPVGYVALFGKTDKRLYLKTEDGDVFVVTVGSGAPKKESFTLSPTDISNGYVTLAYLAQADTMFLVLNGVIQSEGVDYTLSTVLGVTRLTFAGGLASGGGALASGDTLNVQYQH